jgi:hypothetical protein
MKKITSTILVLLVMTLFFAGCEKNETPTAPTLPPATSMSIDFSSFTTKKSAEAAATDKNNFMLAATVAGVWNTILAVNLSVPVASFNLAVDNTPVYLGSNTWEWNYNFNVIGATYKARLTGQLQTTNVKWEMYISKEGIGAFPELLWYQGTSMLDGKSGQWILNYSQQFPEPVLQIDWAVSGSGIGNIKYTYIREKNDDRTTDLFNTSYLEYGLTSNPLNAFYTVHQNTGVAGVFNDVFIEWSTTLHNGHIMANYYYQDDLWHCWNETGDNAVCN